MKNNRKKERQNKGNTEIKNGRGNEATRTIDQQEDRTTEKSNEKREDMKEERKT